MTIEEIYYSEDMSVRSFNVCKDNDLKDLAAILKYYHEKKTFNNLRNCGKTSNKELSQLCLKYISLENFDTQKNQKPLTSIISSLTRTQREVTNSFIEVNFNYLSIRSQNAIFLFLDEDLKIRNISERILINKNFDIQDIRNVGKKTASELNGFINKIENFIYNVESKSECDLIILRNRLFISKTFSITSDIPNEIIESQSIFKLTDFLVTANKLFEKNKNVIFQKAIKLYNNQPALALDEIAEDLNITRERVRQIRKNCLDQLSNKLQFIKNIDDDLLQKYGIDLNLDFLTIDDRLINLINETNKTNFSDEFITFLIYVYTSDKFELIGNIEDVLQLKYFNSRNRHNWDNFYIVKKNLSNVFDFNNFADDIGNRLSERIEETYSFNIKSHLINFLKNDETLMLSIISPIAEKIINQEFELLIDLNENIVFNRNTVKQVPEYAINALEKLAIPSKIEDLYNLIEKDFPKITKSIDALRGSLQRSSEIIYFGRSSTYGLKKWEKEKEGIRGGTIKDIVFDYLQGKKEPIHIYEIFEEVHKYRDTTNAKSIITNLKLDPQNLFIIFNQSFVGLSDFIYNSNLTNLPKFLGKNIIDYIRKYDIVEVSDVEKHFSKVLEIRLENVKHIIQQLIDNEFIAIDEQNKICK